MISASFRAVNPLPSRKEAQEALEAAVKGYAHEALNDFVSDVLGDRLGLAPKVRGSGPPLVKTEKYIRSWQASAEGTKFRLAPEGYHGNGLSNADLALLLEYGWNDVLPRPHLRLLGAKIMSMGGRVVGRRFLRELRRRT